MKIGCGLSKFRMLLLALAGICLVPGSAYAGYTQTTNGASVKLVDSYGSGPGGEFVVKDSSNVALFSTFCVEHSENINLSTYYTVGSATAGHVGLDYRSDNKTKNGVVSLLNVAGRTSITPPNVINYLNNTTNTVTYGAALLYREFALGQALNVVGLKNVLGLTSYNFAPGAGRVSDANLMQDAIWYFQSQVLPAATLASINGGGNKYVNAVTSFMASNSAATILSRIAGVQMMNLVAGTAWSAGPNNTSGINKQSQMYWDGTGTRTDVPEPASVAMWLTLAVGAAVVRRRRRSSIV